MTLEDQPQIGEVIHVGFKSTYSVDSIRKTSSGSIEVEPGGVIGDYHYQLEVDYTISNRLRLQQFPQLAKLVAEQGGKVINLQQVSLFELEKIENFKQRKFGGEIFRTLEPGMLGENITTKNVRLNEIRLGSIITIGDVKLKVTARRTFCNRMFLDLPTTVKPFIFINKTENSLGELPIGIMCQVLDKGIIKIGDKITVEPNPSFVGKPWVQLPTSAEGKASQDRVQYVPPEDD